MTALTRSWNSISLDSSSSSETRRMGNHCGVTQSSVQGPQPMNNALSRQSLTCIYALSSVTRMRSLVGHSNVRSLGSHPLLCSYFHGSIEGSAPAPRPRPRLGAVFFHDDFEPRRLVQVPRHVRLAQEVDPAGDGAEEESAPGVGLIRTPGGCQIGYRPY
jgi:hypothetical protein